MGPKNRSISEWDIYENLSGYYQGNELLLVLSMFCLVHIFIIYFNKKTDLGNSTSCENAVIFESKNKRNQKMHFGASTLVNETKFYMPSIHFYFDDNTRCGGKVDVGFICFLCPTLKYLLFFGSAF